MDKKRWGRTKVSLKLLGEFLKLPPGNEIVDVLVDQFDRDERGNLRTIEIVVEGNNMPEVDEDRAPPFGTFIYHNYCEWKPY